MVNAPALQGFERIIITKRDGVCVTCAANITPGHGFATLTNGKWHAYCTACGYEYAAQAAGLVRLIEATFGALDPAAAAAALATVVLPGDDDVTKVIDGTITGDAARATVRSLKVVLLALRHSPNASPAAKAASVRPNKYDATCAVCDTKVHAGQGSLTGSKGAYVVQHIVCPPEALAALAEKQAAKQATPRLRAALASIADGRYAWESSHTAGQYVFAFVSTNRKNERSVRQVLGGQGAVKVPAVQQVALAERIARMDAAERVQAVIDYGRLGACGWCGRSLSDRTSQWHGYGSTCADTHGLPYSDDAVPAGWVPPVVDIATV